MSTSERWRPYKNSFSDMDSRILEGIRKDLGALFAVEVDGNAVSGWYQGLTEQKGLAPGTAVRHFNVMHHMMGKAAAIWSKETGIDRNPADQVEVKRPDDQRERYLAVEEIRRMKLCLDERIHRPGFTAIDQPFYRLRLVVLIAISTGMRISEVFALRWSDVSYREGLIAVRCRLKGGKVRYAPMPPELADEIRHYPVVMGEDRIFPPKPGAKRSRQRVERSFQTILTMAAIGDFRFHDLRHTFASWYMMNGGDLYELAKILGHSNIKMTERYAKLAKHHIARTGNTDRELWRLMEGEKGNTFQTGS